MNFQLFSINHRTHSLAQVAQGALAAKQLEDGLRDDLRVKGLIILSTCNRVEIYLHTTEKLQTLPDIETTSTTKSGEINPCNLNSVTDLEWTLQTGSQALHHLLEVATGLDSMVTGEREIAGQVKRAFNRARDLGLTDGTLEEIFNAALRCSHKVAKLTGLTSRGRSVVSVGLDLCEIDLGEIQWPKAKVLLVGTGSYAGATVKQLQERGVRKLSVLDTSARAKDFSKTRGLDLLPAAELSAVLGAFDLVVTCRGRSQYILTAPLVSAVMDKKTADYQTCKPTELPVTNYPPVKDGFAPLNTRMVNTTPADTASPSPRKPKLIILDLALQADVDPQVAHLPSVSLHSLASVQKAVPPLAEKHLQAGRELVTQALTQLQADLAKRDVDPLIVALRQEFFETAQKEMDRLPTEGNLSAQEVRRAIERLTARLLHKPTAAARTKTEQGQGQEWAKAVQTLWDLPTQTAMQRQTPAQTQR